MLNKEMSPPDTYQQQQQQQKLIYTVLGITRLV